MRNRTIHKCDLRKISEILEIHIELISIKDGVETCRVEHYGKEHLEKYELGLMSGHYFINDRTDITSYSLINYNDVKDVKECNKIYRKLPTGAYKRDSSKSISSYNLFKLLLANKDTLLTPITLSEEILRTQFYDKTDTYETLDYTDKSYRLEERRTPKTTQVYKIFFDFETITSEEHHIPYLCWIYNADIQQEFIGIENCAINMLNALPTDKDELLLIAHNSNYDCRFILKYLQKVSTIQKDGTG